MDNLPCNSSFHDAEHLALYREQLLPETERSEIESRLQTDPALCELDRQLQCADLALRNWGQYHRIRAAVLRAKRDPAPVKTPIFLPTKSSSFLRPIVAAALFLAVLSASVILTFSPGDRFAEIERIGDVVVEDAVTTERVTIRTINVAQSASLEVRMGDGKSFAKFAENTEASITGSREIRLDRGTAYHKVSSHQDAYRVITPHGVVTVLGTTFKTVVNGDKTEVTVEQGRVELRNSNGENQTSRIIELGSRQSAIMQASGISAPVAVQGRISPWAPKTTEITPSDMRNVLR